MDKIVNDANCNFIVFSKLAITDRTIYSCGLLVAFLSNPYTVVAGCGLCCPHRNPN